VIEAASFLAPDRLLLLALPVVLAVAYLLVLRQRRKAAVRFTSVDLLASVAPRRSGWQRHLGPLLLLGALAALVVGVARPYSEEKVAKERGTIVLALDTSASMGATDVSPTRLEAAKSAAKDFVGKLPRGLQMGLISFDRNARVLVSPTDDRDAVGRGIDQLQLGPGTATGDAIFLALESIRITAPGADGNRPPAAIVLMSDGEPTIGRPGEDPYATVQDAITEAKNQNVPVTTIAFGTPDGYVVSQGRRVAVPADPEEMATIAQATGGQTYTAESAGQLESVYDTIGRTVGFTIDRSEHTATWTAIGLVLASLAAVAALKWNQRLV
jgi:Ca-activated chloride channel family protein